MILTKRNLNLKFVADFKAAMNCFHKERPMRTDQFRATIKRFLIFLHLKKKKEKKRSSSHSLACWVFKAYVCFRACG